MAFFEISSVLPQEFAFPESIIFYISKHPSKAKIYKKLVQCCKYFFVTNPILILSNFESTYWQLILDETVTNVEILSFACRLWITTSLKISSMFYSDVHQLGKIASKIFKSEADDIVLFNQVASLDEFAKISSNASTIQIDKTVIKKDGIGTSLDVLLDKMPKLENCYITVCDFPQSGFFPKNSTRAPLSFIDVSGDTVKKMVNLSNFKQMKELKLLNVPETFDITNFYDYVKTNTRTKIGLNFWHSISPAYQNKLQMIVNELVAAKDPGFLIPGIYFKRMLNQEFLEKFIPGQEVAPFEEQ